MKKNIIITIFISAIMILSVLGFSIGSFTSQNKIKYQGKTFLQSDQGWITYINDKQLILINNPNEISNITIPVALQELNSATKIYISLDTENSLDNAYSLFQQDIIPLLTPQIVISCIKDSEKCADMPLKTCQNATLSNKIIQIQYSQQPSLSYKNNCLLMQGTQDNLIKQIEALTLSYIQ